MRTYTGIVTGQEIGKNLDGENDVRIIQVEVTEPDDVQTIQQISVSGDDISPVNGDTVVIIEVSEAYKIVIGSQDKISPTVLDGERKIYSQADGSIKSYIYCKADGVLELNGNADFAVRFSELETAFNTLKDDFNSFVTTKYNTHVHPTAPVGPTTPPSLVGTSSTADVSGAKIETIKVP